MLDAAGTVSAIAWSPDGKRALTFGAEGLAIWDIATGHRTPALPGHVPWVDHDEAIEALLLSRALGRDLLEVSGLDADRTPLDAPALLDDLVPVATLERMSRRDLRILRNMVYARRGRPFRSEILRDYFQRLDWYKADPAYTDARLTPVDRRNIKIIQSAEIKRRRPASTRSRARRGRHTRSLMIPQAPRAGAKTQEAKAGNLSRVASLGDGLGRRLGRTELPSIANRRQQARPRASRPVSDVIWNFRYGLPTKVVTDCAARAAENRAPESEMAVPAASLELVVVTYGVTDAGHADPATKNETFCAAPPFTTTMDTVPSERLVNATTSGTDAAGLAAPLTSAR